MNYLGLFLGIVSYTWLYHTFVHTRSVLHAICTLCCISFYLVRIVFMVRSMWVRNTAEPFLGSAHTLLSLF